jgi:superfamily I DNA and/or RNA helicase
LFLTFSAASLLASYPTVDPGSIGVVTPYAAQVGCIRVALHSGLQGGDAIEVSTIDAFQGREKDIIIMSCVRAGRGPSRTFQKKKDFLCPCFLLPIVSISTSCFFNHFSMLFFFDSFRIFSDQIGFVKDVRRMNVGITRARHAMWIVGRADTLRASPAWAALLLDADQRGLLLSSQSIQTTWARI